jgi:hypothetical protein
MPEVLTYGAAEVGTSYPPYTFCVTDSLVREYCAAVLDENPFYEQSAQAPPTLAAVYARWVVVTGQILPAGTVHAKQAYKFLKPVSPGQCLRSVGTILDKYMKKENRYVLLETRTYNEFDDLVTVSHMTVILPE